MANKTPMIQFEKLRLQGFKSFVDRTELDIGPGLNGIVGPNGCGKSNLVEALRWVMGESSAKKMRGGGMEDVIFAGSSNRPARNIAEVSLLMNNERREAPAAYNHLEEIEITRKIERDHGSTYKINGKTVRARDTQLLLADTLTGSNSPALVSQGRVTQMINAKPHERRMILEESAGIAGLYARRHEAELRLKAADTNLTRLEDIVGSMESRLNALKRQARQASKYKNLSAQIRQHEVLIAYLEWLGLEEKRKAHEKAFAEAESIVAEKLAAVTQLTKTQNTQAEELPPLRKAEADCAAALQTQKIALQRIEDEEVRVRALIEETKAQLAQTERDKSHEQQSLEDNSKALERIAEEQDSILEAQKGEAARLETLGEEKDALEKAVEKLESQYTAMMESAAEARARRQSLEEQLRQNESRLNSVMGRKERAEAEEAELLASGSLENEESAKAGAVEVLRKECAALEEQISKDQDLQGEKDDTLKSAREGVQAAREMLQAQELKASEFRAELSMLESFFEDGGDKGFASVLDNIETAGGFEKALSRALGDSLSASLDEGAPSYWLVRSSLKDLPALPDGAEALLPKIKAPKELQVALGQIGYVPSFEAGQKLVHDLQPGQALVSRDGDYWRWDGYCMKADAADRNAQHLEQKNKLAGLRGRQPEIDKALEAVQRELEAAQAKLVLAEDEVKALSERLREARESLKNKERGCREAEQELVRIREKRIKQDGALARVREVLAEANEELGGLKEAAAKQKALLEDYDAAAEGDQQEQADALKARLLEAREGYQHAVRTHDRILQEKSSREARLQAIGDERVNLQNRKIRSSEQVKNLSARSEDLQIKLNDMQAKPKNYEDDKQALLSKIAELEAIRDAAAEKLAVMEREVAETSKALKEAESILGRAREDRASAHATLSALKEQTDGVIEAVYEKFEMKPHELKSHIAVALDESTLVKLQSYKDEKEKLVRERDAIGPVNLRADQEAQELEKEAGGLLSERNDLIQAVEELRGGIQKINKEARERLLNAFHHINGHFQKLFVQLFQGGQAHLELIDSDDPLGAGLEIFAQPPGKSLQSLSLLSGGEQTLASIALIFAMFLTNPSPICVLDEIDAPLDDANVDRVCDLLDEIAERGTTRFLIITHHRLTMARMDRLYGVTMAERGISQLVSVDLQQSFEFLDAA